MKSLKIALSLGLFSCLVAVATLAQAAPTHVQKQSNGYTLSGDISGAVYVTYSAPEFMPGMLAPELRIDHPHFAYPIPVNDPKRNNRLFPFAQHERNWNVASHYRS